MSTTLLDKILAPDAISTVFQPIYKIGPAGLKPVIVECLSRGPALTNAAHPGVFFEYVQLKAAEPQVDRACAAAALAAIARLRSPEIFSLNVFAATLVRDSDFVRWVGAEMKRLNLNPAMLIFELVEHGEAWDTQAFLGALRDLRALGSTIALDDVGLAHSNFQRILDCDPEFLKLDRCIVRNCDRDDRRQALLRSLALLANDLGAHLIAEGVETPTELSTLRSHAITLFQGYLFSRPVPATQILDILGTNVPRKPSSSTSEPEPTQSKAKSVGGSV